MFRRSLTMLAVAACTFAPLASVAATTPAAASDTTGTIAPMKSHAQLVHMTLKNLSNLTQNLVIEGRPVSLAANETYKVDLPAGTQILGADNTVKLTVEKQYQGGVASFR